MVNTKLLIFFFTLDAVLTSPIGEDNYADNSFEFPETDMKNNDVTRQIRRETLQLLKEKRNCANGEESSECSSSEEDSSEESTRILREIPLDYLESSVGSSLPYYENYQGYPNVEAIGLGIGSYKGVLIPHVHPKLFAPYYPGFTVKSLPPVVSTYIHGLVPQEEMRRSRYNLDELSSQNTLFLPPVLRPTRTLSTTEEELLAELRHDSIMNNIIPTMPVPFARFAALAAPPLPGPTAYESASTSAAVVASSLLPEATPSKETSNDAMTAVFSTSGSGGLAEPIPYLFSCIPKISAGTLRQVYPDAINQAASYTAYGYKKEAESEHSKIETEKHNAPTKVDLTSKSAHPKQ